MKRIKPIHFCKDCKYAYDAFNEGYDGQPLLCHCQNDDWAKMLKCDWCEKFEKREKNVTDLWEI